jgi:tripartite-type tricarboxylate transporter receptor subunit TctC
MIDQLPTLSAQLKPAVAKRGLLKATVAATVLGASAAKAQSSRGIRLIVPFPAGGATDIIARVMSQKLAAALGQSVTVENRPGAGGTIGADAVAKAAPDGQTLLMATSSTHSIGPAINPKIPYDAFKEFTPIAQVAEAPSVLVVGASAPVGNLNELIRALKSSPGKFNYGSSGIGTYPHLAAELFKWRAGGVFVVHIPYRGTGLVIPDLVAGQILFLMDSAVSAQPHIRDGRVKALAVSGTQRLSSLPQVPTFEEQGLRGMNISNWFGLFAPAGLAPDLLARINLEVNKALAQPDTLERFDKVGATATPLSPAQFASNIKREFDDWKAVIQRAGIKPE